MRRWVVLGAMAMAGCEPCGTGIEFGGGILWVELFEEDGTSVLTQEVPGIERRGATSRELGARMFREQARPGRTVRALWLPDDLPEALASSRAELEVRFSEEGPAVPLRLELTLQPLRADVVSDVVYALANHQANEVVEEGRRTGRAAGKVELDGWPQPDDVPQVAWMRVEWDFDWADRSDHEMCSSIDMDLGGGLNFPSWGG